MRPIPENPAIELKSLCSFYHFHFATGYVFPGERHPFWEMVCVLGGQVDIGADERVQTLGAGDVIFHRPNEFHSIWANYAHAPDLLVMSFVSDSPAMGAFEKRMLHVTDRQQAMLAELLREAENTFIGTLEITDKPFNPRRSGGSYTLRLLLTRILMDMLDEGADIAAVSARTSRPAPDEQLLIQSILDDMRAHLKGGLQFPELCRHVGMSGTAVKQLFHRRFETTPMAYYERLRMNEARRRLREEGLSIAEVADALGFSSPAYFSARFRQTVGMSPREFLKEIRG